ncbi:MAG TPA: DNA alkylation repair protein [Chthoniobacterales bacterium]|nr:DNA alkylation repair protein [Chthoniobacterales bacterium]
MVANKTKASVDSVLSSLKRHSSVRTREGMARYGIPSENASGVTVADIRLLAKRLGRDHDLALALWETGSYEARMLTPFIDEPARVTPSQMDRWCRDFDSWAICDALCFHLFDKTPHAWRKIAKWSEARAEFVRRAAFALLASVALHDKTAPDKLFLDSFSLIERAATDNRNFIKKAVSWALRGIGKRNAKLHAAALKLARRLSASTDSSTRWIGRDALRDLATEATRRRLTRSAS